MEGFATGEGVSVTYARRTILYTGLPSTQVLVLRTMFLLRRSIAPAGIAPDTATNHKISDTKQIIKPFGDTMTLWGSRIIPDIAAVYPQGVAGVWYADYRQLHTNRVVRRVQDVSARRMATIRQGCRVPKNAIHYAKF